eukprot:EG_transcript_24964
MSLGWCAESGILPRKRRYIHGISSATMVGLRAQMAKAQQNRTQQALKTSKGTVGKGIQQVLKNKGVEARDAQDAEEQRRSTDINGRLTTKASLYDRLTREGAEAGEEGLVDFEQKAMDEEARGGPWPRLADAGAEEYDAAGKRRRAWEITLVEEQLEEERRARVRRLLAEVCDETSRARERVLHLREQKRRKELRRLAMLKERRRLQQEGLRPEPAEDVLAKLYAAINAQESESSE